MNPKYIPCIVWLCDSAAVIVADKGSVWRANLCQRCFDYLKSRYPDLKAVATIEIKNV